MLGPPTPTFPGINELPRSGIGDDLESGNTWSPWMVAGLALATSGAGLSLGAKLMRDRRHGSPGRPGGGSGARLHRASQRREQPGAPARVLVRVAPIADFSDFVAVLRALNQTPAVEQAQAALLENNTGLFEVTPLLPLASQTLIEALERALGRNIALVPDD